MHPSQSVTREQAHIFQSLSGVKEGLTYDQDASTVMYLRRTGITLAIECYKNGRYSHTVDSSTTKHVSLFNKFRSMRREQA